MTRLLVALACFSVLGCGDDRTQVMVIVDAEPSLQSQIGAVRIAVYGGSASDEVPSTPAAEGPVVEQAITVERTWPVTHAVIPAGGDASRRFRVVATALAASDGTELLTVRAIAEFEAGQTRALYLRFYEVCLDTTCDADDETCDERGRCVPAETDTGVYTNDAGTDAGTAELDGGADGGGPTDGGPLDGGRPVPVLGWTVSSTPAFGAAAGKAVHQNAEGTIVALLQSNGASEVGGVTANTTTGSDHFVAVLLESGEPQWARGFGSPASFTLHDVWADATYAYVAGSCSGGTFEAAEFFGVMCPLSGTAFAGRIQLSTGNTGASSESFTPGRGYAVATAGTVTYLGGDDGTARAAVTSSAATSIATLGESQGRTWDIAPTASGTALAVGHFRSTVVVMAGADELVPQGMMDGFVVEVSAGGALRRGLLLGGPGVDSVRAVTVTAERVYIAGELDVGATIMGDTISVRSAFVAALDGARLDVIDYLAVPLMMSTAEGAAFTGIAVNARGAVFTGGRTETAMWQLPSENVGGIVVVRLDAELDHVWHRQLGPATAASRISNLSLAALSDGSIVAAGAFPGNVVLQQIREEVR